MNIKNKINISFVKGTLLIDIPAYISFNSLFNKIELIYDKRINQYRCDAIHYGYIINQLKKNNIEFESSVSKWCVINWGKINIPDLRDEQIEAVSSWLKTKKGVIIMPTGSGKTVVALAIMKALSVSTLIIAPVRDLMYQWQNRISEVLGYDSGIIGDNIFDIRPISCTTYHSAYIHMDKLGDKFGLIIFDECHHLPGLNRREAALMSPAPFRLGLTATPERSDELHKDFPYLIGPIVYDIPITELAGKVLADYDIFRIPVALNSDEQFAYNSAGLLIRNYMLNKIQELKDKGIEKKYTWIDLIKETGKDPEARKAQQAFYFKKSIEDRAEEKFRVLEDLFRLHLGEPILIFAGSNAMARDVSIRFLIPCLLSHSKKRERQDILKGFENGTYPAIIANQVLDEGVDIPIVKIAIVLGGESSSRQAKQRLGRILRKVGNKRGKLYEIVCTDTGEVKKSRKRRNSDAYKRTLHRKL